jgi:hypothetical protein
MTRGKYHREYDAKHDKQQATFNPLSPLGLTVKQQTKVDICLTHTGIYLCPFCLHPDPINSFLISSKQGYNKSMVKCPECKQNFRLKTLTAKMTPEQYADFLYEYSRQGGWQKVTFKIWKERLAQLGWSQTFWERYKALKGDSDDTSYTGYIERQQQEDKEAYEAQQHDT